MRPLMPNPTLKSLEVLVGEWALEIPQYPDARGQVIFEWLEGGAFLVQRSQPEPEEFPASVSIIGRDDSLETFSMLYYDSRGVSRIYQMSLSDDVWKLWRDAPGFAQRFTGTFGDGGATITGRFELSSDGSHWEHDFDLTYRRVR